MRRMQKTAAIPTLATRATRSTLTALLACIGLLLHTPAQAQTNTEPAAQAEFDACLSSLRAPARAAGVQDATFTQHTQNLAPDLSVIEKLNFQPEFRMPIWDYLAGLVDDERVAEGQALLAQHADTLARVQQRYGVDPATVVAVWGVESNFGQTLGKYPLVQALGTLSCMGRRQAFFRGEFYATLRILQAGHIAPERLVGSWAGAFGHTQFMPTTFERLAVDLDGDGKRDLMDSTASFTAEQLLFINVALKENMRRMDVSGLYL